MLFEVNLPSLSPTMEEGKIVKWVKKEKDPILSGEVLFEVETDKATMEYESPEDGYIVKILTSEGEIAKVNELVAIISDSQNVEESELNKFISENNLNSVELKNSSEIESNEVLSNNSSKKIQITPLAKKISKLKGINIEKIIPASRRIHLSDLNQITTEGNNPSANNKLFISPFAKVLAKERSINIEEIQGSGPLNRIIGRDILNINTVSDNSKVNKLRQAIAKATIHSKQNIPHFYLKY